MQVQPSAHLEKAYAVIEAFALPGAMVATAILLHTLLGAEIFGRFAFVTAFLGLGALTSIGVPVVLQTELPRLSRTDSDEERARVIAALGATVIFGGGLLIALIAASIFFFGERIFADLIDADNRLQMAATVFALLFFQQADQFLSALLKARFRIRDAAYIEMFTRAALVAGVALSVRLYPSPLFCVGVVCTSLAASTLLKACAARRELAAAAGCFGASRGVARALRSNVQWTWAQGAAAAVFSTADRFVIAALMNPAALGTYVLCVQIAQVILAFPAAALQPALPRFSELAAHAHMEFAAELKRVRTVNLIASAIILVVASALGLVVIHQRPAGAGDHAAVVMLMLATGYFIASLNVHAHYALMALNKQRTVSLINGGAGLAMLFMIAVATPLWGIEGAALGRMIFGFILLYDIYALKRVLR